MPGGFGRPGMGFGGGPGGFGPRGFGGRHGPPPPPIFGRPFRRRYRPGCSGCLGCALPVYALFAAVILALIIIF